MERKMFHEKNVTGFIDQNADNVGLFNLGDIYKSLSCCLREFFPPSIAMSSTNPSALQGINRER